MSTNSDGNVSHMVIPECYWACLPWYNCVYVCMENTTDFHKYVVKGEGVYVKKNV